MIFPVWAKYPLTILEAVCCGLPVVCYSNTGMTEMINELNLRKLEEMPRLLDNLTEPNDKNVIGTSSMKSQYMQVFKNLNNFSNFIPKTIPIQIRFCEIKHFIFCGVFV